MAAKKGKRSRGLIILFSILILILGAVILYAYQMLNKMERVEIPKNDEDLGIKEPVEDKSRDKEIINIALFGLDSKNSGDNGRSDSIMIGSLDKKHKKIKLTSIMRDTYVDIPGRGMDKIGHAYAFGGPELGIKTINQNFNTDIRDFVSVDFSGFEAIVDILGGVEIDVKDYEVSRTGVERAGRQLLNGKQALSYARIRKVGDGDYERTERHRVVLEEIINRSLKMNVGQYPKLLDELFPLLNTSISKTQILNMSSSMITSNIKEVEQFRLPVDNHLQHRMINGVFYIEPMTLEDNISVLNEFIYDDKR